ncbi:hypothetical protein MRX96_028000 [Rhipicephalus microplus]
MDMVTPLHKAVTLEWSKTYSVLIEQLARTAQAEPDRKADLDQVAAWVEETGRQVSDAMQTAFAAFENQVRVITKNVELFSAQIRKDTGVTPLPLFLKKECIQVQIRGEVWESESIDQLRIRRRHWFDVGRQSRGIGNDGQDANYQRTILQQQTTCLGRWCANRTVGHLAFWGRVLPWRRSVRYLGITPDHRLSWKPAVASLQLSSRRVAGAASSLLARGKGCSPGIALRMYNAVAGARALYAFSLFTLCASQWDTLEMVHRGIIRRLFGLPRTSPVGIIYAETNQFPLSLRAKACALPNVEHMHMTRGGQGAGQSATVAARHWHGPQRAGVRKPYLRSPFRRHSCLIHHSGTPGCPYR